MRRFESTVSVRSYELDSFGHLNHAVYLNYFEFCRFEALKAGGYSLASLSELGLGIHVVRVEVDYRHELRLGDQVRVLTWVAEWRRTSMVFAQEAYLAESDVLAAEARVVAVWVGPNRKPVRIPEVARAALG